MPDNAASGSLFLMTDLDQYVYDSAFHLKVPYIALADVNVAAFYQTTFRRVQALGPRAQPPLLARVGGAVSLVLWVTVIVYGRMITFYRHGPCPPDRTLALLAACFVR